MRIDEFEFRNKQGEEIEPTKDQLVVYIKSLHKEIKTLNKALELACDCFYVNFGKVLEPYCGIHTSSEAMQKHFKTKAKEMLKSDKDKI